MPKTRKRPSTKRSAPEQKRGAFSQFLHDNALSIVTISAFVFCWIGQSVTGWLMNNDDLASTGQHALTYAQYLASPHFFEATFENWESEFLQLSMMVVLTIFLRQKGSPESKDDEDETAPPQRGHRFLTHRGLTHPIYDNSLSIVLVAIFLFCFGGHAISSYFEHNAEHRQHHEPTESFGQVVTSAGFWFESFQNWQSEFLAVAALTLLSIKLRQKGSPESKDPDES